MTHPVDAGRREEVEMGNAVTPVLLSYPRALDVIVDTATAILYLWLNVLPGVEYPHVACLIKERKRRQNYKWFPTWDTANTEI